MKYLVPLLLSFSTSITFAQLDTLFWFAAPEVSIHNQNFDRPILMRISTVDVASTVVIDQPANPTFVPITVNVAAASTQTVDLTPWIDQIENKPPNQVLNYGLRVVSSSPVTIYYEVRSATCNCNPEIFALKGQNALGTEFFIPSQHYLNNSNAYSPLPFSSFDLIATEDNTQVTITPTQNIVGHAAAVPFTVNLNKGQTYSATATSQAAAQHLFGSTVSTNLPIAITVKDDLLNGAAFGGCADLAGDQSIPLDIIGNEYIVVRGFLNPPYDQVFILATQNNTSISINGVPTTTINTGQSFNYSIGAANAAYIEASAPVYVLQLSGFGCEVGLSVLPPIICTGSQRISFARSTAESLFLILLVEAGGENNFLLNGMPGIVTPANFSFVPGTANGWMYAQMTIPTNLVAAGGTGVVTNSTNFFHMGMIHGSAGGGCRFGYFSDFAKYKYQIQSNDEVYCVGDSIVLATNALPGATYQWEGPNGFLSSGDTLIISPASLSNTGEYIVSGNLPNACTLLPDSIQINIIEAPNAPTIFNNGPVCENDSLLVWNSIGSPYTFIWTDDQGNALPANDTLLFYPALNDFYTVHLTSTLGDCSSPPTVVDVDVLNSPTLSYSGALAICGDSTSLSATFSMDPLDLLSSITWYNLEGTTIGTGSVIPSFQSTTQPESKDSIVVSLATVNGCTAFDTIEIAFHPLPNVDFNWIDLCNGSDVQFINASNWTGIPSTNDEVQYEYSFGENSFGSVPDTVFSYDISGTYTVQLSGESVFGCRDSIPQQIEILPVPTAELEIDDGCGEVYFSSMVSPLSFAIDSMNWVINGQSLSTNAAFNANFNQSGNFNGVFQLTGENGCSFAFPFQFNVIASIPVDELEIPNVITANGDGINDELILNDLFTNCSDYSLKILNRWGTVVFEQNNASIPFNGTDQKGDPLASGVYFYTLESGDNVRHGHITLIR
jgi:gliding motility-associated-like protein